jgi:hypothetical protein
MLKKLKKLKMTKGFNLNENTTKRGLICAPMIGLSIFMIVTGNIEGATVMITLTQLVDAWLKIAFTDGGEK